MNVMKLVEFSSLAFSSVVFPWPRVYAHLYPHFPKWKYGLSTGKIIFMWITIQVSKLHRILFVYKFERFKNII